MKTLWWVSNWKMGDDFESEYRKDIWYVSSMDGEAARTVLNSILEAQALKVWRYG